MDLSPIQRSLSAVSEELESIQSRDTDEFKPKYASVANERTWRTREPEIIQNTNNPIRKIVDNMRLIPNEEYPMIALSIGDPSVYGNFDPSPIAVDAVREVLEGKKDNGYGPAIGVPAARKAIAEYIKPFFGYTPDVDNIALASGASGALEFAISCLAERGDNILLPRPGFPLYSVLAEGQGIKCKYYDLDSNRDWAVDYDSLENAIDQNTTAVVFINPSNPTGSVFKQNHMERLVELCEQYKLTIIADEIYAGMTFHDAPFLSFCKVARRIPVVHIGGLAKRFLVPGWRMGWTIVHDPANIFKGRITTGIKKLATRLVGPNKLIQSAIPKILSISESWHNEQNTKLEEAADLFYDGIMQAPGLIPIMPDGAMYMMVKIDFSRLNKFSDDMHFCQSLVSEKSVFCLPGSCFGFPNFFRVVITIPKEKIPEACDRIRAFCDENQKSEKKTGVRRTSELLAGGSANF